MKKHNDFNPRGKIRTLKRIEGKKPLDYAMDKIKEQDMEAGKHKPYLDAECKIVQNIDNKIEWHQSKIAELEKLKQAQLSKVSELFDLAMVHKHELKNGYIVKTDNRYKLEVQSVGDFLKWLKANVEPQDVLKFFEDAIKITKLKSFVEHQINLQRIEGELEPKVDGIKIFDVTFRRLTTTKRKVKND